MTSGFCCQVVFRLVLHSCTCWYFMFLSVVDVVGPFLDKLSTERILTLWILGNYLKLDYIVVCFLKPLNSACFLLGMMDWVANRLDLRPAAEYSAAGLDQTCLHKHKCGSSTERVNPLYAGIQNGFLEKFEKCNLGAIVLKNVYCWRKLNFGSERVTLKS